MPSGVFPSRGTIEGRYFTPLSSMSGEDSAAPRRVSRFMVTLG